MDEREKRKSKLSFRTNIRPEIIIFTYRKTEEFIKMGGETSFRRESVNLDCT